MIKRVFGGLGGLFEPLDEGLELERDPFRDLGRCAARKKLDKGGNASFCNEGGTKSFLATRRRCKSGIESAPGIALRALDCSISQVLIEDRHKRHTLQSRQ